jgi:iron complex transport system permease protein
LLGGLTRASWPQNAVLLFAFIIGGALLLSCARDLNALRAGEEDAIGLGVEIGRVHRKILLAASLLAAACVAAAGLIGFVGLLAPHLVRLLGGRDARVLLPGAALPARHSFAPVMPWRVVCSRPSKCRSAF